ncbi:hypothetical protein LPJ73_004443 [Coemansia sp. RSA 2703]|nr:hypothetical protein LPJ73_004443 [Coemansia sp. RSA 2703]KAJ2384360.1 hypothetical protein GGI05_005032 [Coemansia sp. RSA 2603]
MQPIGTQAPADTRSCLRYWPMTCAVSVNTSGQMQYRGIVEGELALDVDFERLSLVDRDPSLQAAVHDIVSEAFTSDAIQKL